MKQRYLLLCLLALAAATANAQNNRVTIDYAIQRFLGTESTFDRGKYINYHNTGDDAEFTAFKREYRVGEGRFFWGPFSFARNKNKDKEVGVYPSPKAGPRTARAVQRKVATEHPANVVRYNLSTEAAAEWAAEYYRNFVDDNGRPAFFEPMNEPFVHARDAVYKEQQPDDQKMRVRMAEWFGAIGKKFRQTPELANMKVLGYSSAWPSMELWDFGHWETRMKMFMDVAGEHMDGLSTHLYDGINVQGQNSIRSGSNSEAILDLIETYSYVKWQKVLPHAITEFGAIEKGYPAGFNPAKSIQSVKAINHLLFNLLERQDRLLIAIPFITGKATWHITEKNNYEYYTPALWRPTKVTPTDNPNKPIIEGWQYTPRVHFFDLWREVEGERVFIHSNNPDIQALAFAHGATLYVALGNLDDKKQGVGLHFVKGLPGLRSVRAKALKIYDVEDPVYTDQTTAEAPGELALLPGETVVLAYTFENPLAFGNQVRVANYYSSAHLRPIEADKALSFAFGGVATGSSIATLKLGIGRKHDRSKQPIVAVNGTPIAVPDNWKGYDQANREDFFGVIDIPFNGALLQKNNQVTVTFPDTGGRVSSLVLAVERFDAPEPELAQINDVVLGLGHRPLAETSVYPNPAKATAYIKSAALIKEVVLVDVLGEVVARQSVQGHEAEVPMGALADHQVYFVHIKTTAGTTVRKIVKK